MNKVHFTGKVQLCKNEKECRKKMFPYLCFRWQLNFEKYVAPSKYYITVKWSSSATIKRHYYKVLS
jgi:hypothetical protein